MTERKYVGKRYKGAVHVPSGMNLEDALTLYTQGWGHSLRASMTFLRKNGFFVDKIHEKIFTNYVNNQQKLDKIHLVKRNE